VEYGLIGGVVLLFCRYFPLAGEEIEVFWKMGDVCKPFWNLVSEIVRYCIISPSR